VIPERQKYEKGPVCKARVGEVIYFKGLFVVEGFEGKKVDQTSLARAKKKENIWAEFFCKYD
jgi:hypothetical protein